MPSGPGEVYVDCTAAGVPPVPTTPIFAPGRIALRYVTVGQATWSAAIVGTVEASGADDATKNRLTKPVPMSGEAAKMLEVVHAGLLSEVARARDAELLSWNQSCRLNPGHGAAERMADDPELIAAFSAMVTAIGPALRKLSGRSEVAAAPA